MTVSYLRYSINAFNQQEDLDRLLHALLEIKGRDNYWDAIVSRVLSRVSY